MHKRTVSNTLLNNNQRLVVDMSDHFSNLEPSSQNINNELKDQGPSERDNRHINPVCSYGTVPDDNSNT